MGFEGFGFQALGFRVAGLGFGFLSLRGWGYLDFRIGIWRATMDPLAS